MTSWMRATPFITQMHRGQFPAGSCRHQPVDGLHRQSGRNASPSGITPSTIMSPTRSNPGSWTEIRLGARAHTTDTANRPHAPPPPPAVHLQTQTQRLTAGPAQIRSDLRRRGTRE
jgi:hypothetical protein